MDDCTPGPWTASPYNDLEAGGESLINGSGFFRKAGDARLCAAAHDMRKALEEMLAMAELFVPAKLDAPGFARARAALAKAKVACS